MIAPRSGHWPTEIDKQEIIERGAEDRGSSGSSKSAIMIIPQRGRNLILIHPTYWWHILDLCIFSMYIFLRYIFQNSTPRIESEIKESISWGGLPKGQYQFLFMKKITDTQCHVQWLKRPYNASYLFRLKTSMKKKIKGTQFVFVTES